MEKLLFKYRVGIVVETPSGVILTQEIKDTARTEALEMIEEKIMMAERAQNTSRANRYKSGRAIIVGGRFSLPGGGTLIKDFEALGETRLIDEIGIKIIKRPGEDETLLFPDIERLPEEVGMRVERVMRRTALREIEEELNIVPDPTSLENICQIMGDTRRHLIYIITLDGEIKITDRNISGIGFIDRAHVIPLSKYFFQGHVRTLYSHYICDQRREQVAKAYGSRLIVPMDLVEGWFRDEMSAYHYLSGKGRQRVHLPKLLESKPAFRIRGKDGELVELRSELSNFTVSKAAKLIPRTTKATPDIFKNPDAPAQTPPLAKPRRSTSNPSMKAVEKKPA